MSSTESARSKRRPFVRAYNFAEVFANEVVKWSLIIFLLTGSVKNVIAAIYLYWFPMS